MAALLRLVVPLVCGALLAGCGDGADDFFSGRPSGMAMAHNRVIGGPPEAMVDLLRVPSRFPAAKQAHVADWQESAIAWWGTEKRGLMVASFRRLSGEEAQAVKNWVRVRDPHRSREKAQLLDEIDAALEK